MPSTSPRYLHWREKAAYAVGDTACCFYWQTFSTFLMIFYTDTFGLAPAAVATMFLITRIWDAAIDPVMGTIADRTESKHGKFRVWILRGIFPFTIAGIAMFYTPDFSATGKLVYAYVTYTLVMMTYSLVNVPYGALLGVITPNSDERTALAAYRFVGAFAGNLLVQWGFLTLIAQFGKGDDRIGYPLAFAVYAVAAAALLYWTFVGTRERVVPRVSHNAISTDLKDLVKNTPWVTLCIVGLITLTYISIRNGVTLYYFKYYIGDESAARFYLVLGTVFSILGSLTAPWFTRMSGSKRNALIVLTLLGAGLMVAFYFVKPGNNLALYVLNALVSIPHAAMFPLIWSMYADTADYGEWKYDRRATGLVFSAATFSQKVGWGVGGAVTGYILGAIGFIANVPQSEGAQFGIRNMLSVIPAGVALAAVVAALFYGINGATERQMAADLKARHEKTA